MGNAADKVKDAGEDVYHKGEDVIHDIIHGGGSVIDDGEDWFEDHDPLEGIGEIFEKIGANFEDILKEAKQGTTDLLEDIDDQFESGWDWISGTGVFDELGDLAGDVGGLAKSTYKLSETLLEMAEGLIQSLPQVLQSIARLLQMTIQGIIYSVDAVNENPKMFQAAIIFIVVGWLLKDNSLFM